MGALTLKTFPYEIRGWDVESYESVDPTDSFGQNTKVYIENNKIVKIEPNFSNYTSSPWLTDKGRHFFDSLYPYKKLLFSKTENKKNMVNFEVLKWDLGQALYETLYIFNMCNLKNVTKHFFIILFEYLSIEVLNLLLTLAQAHLFIKLKRAENFKLNNDLESNFQLNSALSLSKLGSSSLCLLIGTNTRYENSHLNLKLRQRYFKGNFKIATIGSLFDFTFSTSILGSTMNNLKIILEGNNIFCQDLKKAKNPILIYNTEIFKRNDTKNLLKMTKILKFTNIINKIWNGLNTLNSYLNEAGLNTLNSFSFLTFKDLLSFSSIYVINITLNKLGNFKTKFIETKLLNFLNFEKSCLKKGLFVDHTFIEKNNINFWESSLFKQHKLYSKLIKFKSYLYFPSNTFFEDNETFINTEGLIKRTTKLIFKKDKTITKNNWQFIRKFIKYNKNAVIYLNKNKNGKLIFLNSENQYNFKNYINLQFFATQALTDLNFYLNIKNSSFIMYKNNLPFKTNITKLFNTKFKYWLDDYFNGDKDNYSQNSTVLAECSKLLRSNTASFF
jgi:Molybdopterin oxidoreductase